jgi:CBS domain containing-hemolysin-like protein
MTIVAYLVAVASLLTAGILRASGTGVARIPRADAIRDAADGVSGARSAADLLDERDAIPSAVGMFATALLLIAAVVAMAILVPDATPEKAIVVALGVGLVSFLVGDLVPRRVGRARPRIAYRFVGLLAVAVRFGGWANEPFDETDEDPVDSGGGLTAAAEDEQERELIDSVLEFGETIVREVMTPRPDMVTVPLNASLDQLVATAAAEGYSRVPVTSNGDVVGVVIIKDLLPVLNQGARPLVSEVMRPVDFVPDSKLASALLAEMQENHSHQVIVIDEYGDVAGLVTIEDLLEELVGEITDETDEDEVFISETGDRVWSVDGRLPAEDLAEIVGLDLPDGDWDTVGGLVIGLAERIPEVGETFTFGSLRFVVSRMQGRRVSQVVVAVDESEQG